MNEDHVAARHEAPRSSETLKPAGQKPLQDVRILITDDARVIRLKLSDLLKKAGAQVTQAANGHEALVILRREMQEQRPVQLLLLDMNMPELDGLSTLTRLRASWLFADLPVIILSTNTDRENVIECAKLKVCRYLVKTCQFGELIEAVLEAVGKSKTSVPEAQPAGNKAEN